MLDTDNKFILSLFLPLFRESAVTQEVALNFSTRLQEAGGIYSLLTDPELGH